MSESKNNGDATPIHGRPTDYDQYRQILEQDLAALIANFEAERNIPVHRIEIERADYNLYGDPTKLKRYPMREDPHAPLLCVRAEFAKGPLVSATALKLPILAEIPELTEPAETIGEAALRLSKETDRAVEELDDSGPAMTAQEAHLYGGRYA